jgi:FkbM family methyltransferase
VSAAEHGRSDRTQLALLASRFPQRLAGRAEPLLQRGEVAIVHGLGEGLRFPARGVSPRHAQARLLLLGDLEIAVQEALRRTLAPGGVLYDVGANLGFFALLGARLAGDQGQVIAFEPVPATAALAAEAAERSGLAARVEVRAEAVAAASGRALLCVVEEAGWSHLADRGHHPQTTEELDVPVVSLDDVVAAGAPPPDVIKLDVEGSEVDALEGASKLLREQRPVVICELHETNAEVCDLLEAVGYSLENLDGPEPLRAAGPVHLLARPQP